MAPPRPPPRPPPAPPFCGKKRSMGNSLSGEMWNLSPLAYEVATMPSAILIVNIEALIGPKISSTLPTWVLFSRKMGPLK